MALESGARVGEYEIVGPLGSGGMSEVYRARDLTLGREVAIKILPQELARDPDKLARFEREAQLLAALNHKNIAVIHGLEQHDGVSFLVLELIPGGTLAERLRQGPLSLSEARAIFLQIAEALEAAHGKGIIHRDLTPANVKITDDGTVKLLDFGLGKELANVTLSQKTETFDGSVTSPGLVMGTPGYMSPEQSRGRELTKGTDVWSFGVCLFQALSGAHPFVRETVPDTLSAVLNNPPPWERLPSELPRAWRVLLERCLRKSERDRLHDVADVRIELEEAPKTPSAPRGVVPGWAVATMVALAAAALWSVVRSRTAAAPLGDVVRRFVVDLPSTAPLSLDGASALAISPDGTRLVYAARRADRSQMYQRALDQLDAVPILGSEGGVGPFFSPRSDALGFFADGRLKTLTFGGATLTLTDAPAPRGASWSSRSDGAILFAPEIQGGLRLVPATGGVAADVTRLDPGGGASAHRWPSLLPSGTEALVTLWSRDGVAIGVVDLDTGALQPLVDDGSYARYVRSGHLVFVRDGDLHAAVYDLEARRLVTDPVPVVEAVAVDEQTGAAFYELSNDGSLFYVAESSEIENPATMLLVGRDGVASPIGPPRASLQVPRFSPDGRFIAVTVQNENASDIWSLHLGRGNLTRLTFDGTNGAAIWTPNGDRIAFASSRDDEHAIYWKPADGSGSAERLTEPGNAMFPTSFSPDAKTLLYTELHPETSLDVWTFSIETGTSRPLLRTPFAEAAAVFSPDGRFVAFTSDVSGREEVYVRAFPGDEGRWQVSTDGGNEPMWSRDGTAIYYRRSHASSSSLMAVEVATAPSFEPGKPRALFDAPYDRAGALHANYDVTAGGKNFVMIRSEPNAAASRIHVVLNWVDELGRRVPIP